MSHYQPRIIYNNLPDMGGEPISYLLRYGNIKHEEYYINDISTYWYYNHWTYPSYRFPVVQINNTNYTDTLKIGHQLAKQLNLLGDNKIDQSCIIKTVTLLHEFRRHLSMKCIESENFRCYCEYYTLNICHRMVFYFLEIFLELNGDFFFGQVSYLDIFFAVTAKYIKEYHGLDITLGLPKLTALKERVFLLPTIQASFQKQFEG